LNQDKNNNSGPVVSAGPLTWMAKNSVVANLVMLVFLVGGLLAVLRIKQEVFPEFEMDMVSVSVSYPGSTPEDVETGIILSVEEAVRSVDSIKEITSTCSEGSGRVSCELELGADRQQVYQDIKAEVDRITTFPEDAERPEVTLVSHRRGVLDVVIYGQCSEKILREMAERVRDGLLALPEVTIVEIEGVRDPEISVEISQENLRAYGLTLDKVADKIQSYALELPGGGIKTSGGEILIRVDERREKGIEFASIPVITASDGTQVFLGDIARIIDGFEDTDRYTLFNGKPAVSLEVYRVGRQTPTQVASAVKEYIKENKKNLPPGLSIATLHDRSEVYSQRAELLLRNGAYGLILVFCLLGLFLQPRLAFWVMMGIPVSFLGAFLFLPSLGISVNVISMFAFIIALGIVVDDAIIVGENIHEYRHRGLPYLQAAINGAREMIVPVSFSILTNIVTFMPLLFIPGVMGKIWVTIPMVVITIFAVSWFECLFILPSHLSHKPAKEPGWFLRDILKLQERFSHGFKKAVDQIYRPFLDLVLRWRYVTLACGMALLLGVIGFVASGRMGFQIFPKVESDYAFVSFALPYGSPVKKTEAVALQLMSAAQKVIDDNGKQDLYRGIVLEIGRGENGSGSHAAQVRIYLPQPDLRPVSTQKFVSQWRQKVGEIIGLEYITFMSDRGGPGSGKALSLELSHRDIDVLDKAGTELAVILAQFDNTKDIDDGYQQGKPQWEFKLNSAGTALGLDSRSIGRQVRSAFYGTEALRQQRGRDEMKVKVRFPESERRNEYDLENLILRNDQGKEIALREAARAVRGRSYTSITRRDQRRTITVSADVVPAAKAGEVISALKKEALPKLQRKYPGLNYSFEGRQADMRESMQALMIGLLFALLGIYILLAIPFKNYVQPLIVMVSIPFGIVGAVFGHLIMGYSLSLMSVMGIVALSGVVVNDSLVLIDYANHLYAQGKTRHDAVCLSGARRFRPILLTTLTTFGGLAPMIFETSRQARFMIPMALSLGYGLLFATSICLLLVPCLYLMVEDLGKLTAKKNV